jgi:hypothetical protein
MIRQAHEAVVRHRYTRAGQRAKRKLSDALRYMRQRPLGEGEQLRDRRLFTARTDDLERHEARELLMGHADRLVAYHRLILSPGMALDDLQRWTRLTMADLSRHLGQELHWVAVTHRNTAHPHVHVLVAATGERLAGDRRRPTPVLLRSEEYAVLRASGDRHAYDLARHERDLDDAVHAELALLAPGLARALGREGTDDGVQTQKHLVDEHERRGAPGRDATPAR